MIKNQNIICLSNTSWFGNYAKSTVQILSRLAKHNNVLFVEYPYSIKDIFSTLTGRQNAPVGRMIGYKKRLQIIETDIKTSVYNLVIPPMVPVFYLKNEKVYNFFFAINSFIYERVVKNAIRSINFNNPVVITAYNPFYGLALLNKLNEVTNIYYCYDGVKSDFFGERIFKIEDTFSKKVNAIITTSDFLYAQKKKLNSNSFVVKNGVDFSQFNQFAKKEVFKREHKKVGYIGSLDYRFDIDIVENAVKFLNWFDFEFTGDLMNKEVKRRLGKYPNVKFFTPIKPNDVPELLASYDVGIIPYIVNDVNKNIYPLKINEYLAVGVPLVMTSFADLPEFDSFVSIANNSEEFIHKLKEETETDSMKKIEARVEFAKQNSWESRTERFSNIIEKLI